VSPGGWCTQALDGADVAPSLPLAGIGKIGTRRSTLRAMTTTRARIAIAILAIGSLGLLGGCGAATPEGVDIDIEGGEIAISNSEGEFAADFGDASVPEDFPSEVPLPDLPLLLASSGTTGGTKAWSLTYQGGTRADFDAYVEKIRASGSAESVSSIDEGTIRGETFTVGAYDVAVTLVPDQAVGIVVTERS
jgi:hypothetical protein